MTVPKGRCKADGCNVTWEGVDGYLKCTGCDHAGCKIKQKYLERQTNNAKIEAERVIDRMRGRRNTPEQNQAKEEQKKKWWVHEETSTAGNYYEPSDDEIVTERDVRPMKTFRIMP